jgi:hypothetical protein
MEDKIEALEYRINVLEKILDDPWRILLDDAVREYIRKNYPCCGSYDFDLYDRVLEEMKDKIRKILVEDK